MILYRKDKKKKKDSDESEAGEKVDGVSAANNEKETGGNAEGDMAQQVSDKADAEAKKSGTYRCHFAFDYVTSMNDLKCGAENRKESESRYKCSNSTV